MADRVKIEINLPRVVTLKIGRKGSLELEPAKIPVELYEGINGLVLKGMARLLGDACPGKKTLHDAELTRDAWYGGYSTRREAGLLGEAATAPRGPSRKAREDALLDVIRALAVMRTGDETLRDKNKRELRRVLGDDGYAEVERRAQATLE